ncbi:1-phosphofructokinase [Sporolactobacillus sp. STCC-11]|uniref:1-phosphofructokinase n=1 Tax=Sporolactobacillus caesalpiniae TaxID=3230362 RepID=UPI0033971384
MILTLTLNPAIDMNYRLDKLLMDQVNRCEQVGKTPGGKGLNVTRVLQCADEPVCATGFLGGKTGEFISEELGKRGIRNSFVSIAGNTRHCLAIMHEGNQTEILEGGPTISEEEADAFLRHYEVLLDKADVVTASGSLPKGLKPNFYQKLIERAREKGKPFLLDTSGESLFEGIKARPALIKPNQDELAALIGRPLANEEEIIDTVKHLAEESGIDYVMVSLGKNGVIGCCNGVLYKAVPPKMKTVNPVGSGDSMIAGFAYAISRNEPLERVLAYGVTFGTLNAMEDKTGFIDSEQIVPFLMRVEISHYREEEKFNDGNATTI